MQLGAARILVSLTAAVLFACGGGGASSPTGAELESIAVSPSPLATGVKVSRQMAAVGKFSDGTTRDVTTSAAWASSAPAVATVAAGRVTGVSVGSTAITVTSGSVVGQATVAVTQDTWTPVASMATGRAGQLAALLNDGRVLVAGGTTGSAAPYAEIYDPDKNKWSLAAKTSLVDTANTLTVLGSGKVLVSGNSAPDNYTVTAIYDPVADAWQPTKNVPGNPYVTADSAYTATLLPDGDVLFAGGLLQGYGEAVSYAVIYYPSSNSAWQATPMAVNRFGHTATLLRNGKVLVTGGQSGLGSASVVLASTEIYDPASSTWTPAASMITARVGHTATLLPDGEVLVVGQSSSEIYDPVADAWTSAGPAAVGVDSFATSPLPTGTVFVVGGSVCVGPPGQPVCGTPSVAQIFDPSTTMWSVPSAPTYGRPAMTATLLANGAVLVTGGGGLYGPTNACALYW